MQKIFRTTTGEHILFDTEDGAYTIVCETGLHSLERGCVDILDDHHIRIDDTVYTVETGGLTVA